MRVVVFEFDNDLLMNSSGCNFVYCFVKKISFHIALILNFSSDENG